MPSNLFLDRFLEPMTEVLTPEVAHAIVNLRADTETETEIELLRKKAKNGTLTAEEEKAYQDFIDALDVISIIQSKARRFLGKRIR